MFSDQFEEKLKKWHLRGWDKRDIFAGLMCERETKGALLDVISVSLYYLLIVNANSSFMICQYILADGLFHE